MVAFSGRVEALYTIPSSTTVSVSSGALTSAVSVTWTPGSYFHTAAGGVSSGLTALTSAINAAVSPYPDNATSVAAMLGYGDFSSGAGWGFNIASGNDTGLFGGVTMTAVSSPTYRTSTGLSGTDYAIGLDSASDAFSAGDTFDVTNLQDFVCAWVAKFSAAPGSTKTFITKRTTGAGWQILANADGTYTFRGFDATPTQLFSCTAASMHVGSWHVGIATIDRATGKARIGTYSLAGSSSVSTEQTTAATTMANAVAFTVGDDASAAGGGVTTALLAGLYITSGASVATGLSANLSTALTSFASAVNSSFSVSMSTSTGLVTLSNSFWPCAMTLDDDTQSLLGFAYDFDYPSSAAALTAALGGYGDFTSGGAWLCNETSGNLSAAFLGATLTAAGTPTYSNVGARGGADKAVGFDTNTDYFTGGDIYDVTLSDDLIVLWVGRFSSVSGANGWIINKYLGWGVQATSTGAISLATYDGTSRTATTGTTAQLAGEHHVGIAVIDRGAGTMRVGTIGLTSGTSIISSTTSISAMVSTNTTDPFRFGASTVGNDGVTTFTLSYAAVSTGPSVATGLSANLSTALSNFATYMKSQTGTAQAKGVWFPDSPLNCDQHPSTAPDETDARGTESPTGVVLGLSGNKKHAHLNVRWDRCPVDRIREVSATYDNASLQVFFRDCIAGLGHSWFRALSPLQIYWSNAGTDTLLGTDGADFDGTGVAGWSPVSIPKFADICTLSQEGWVGQFNVRFPRLVSSG